MLKFFYVAVSYGEIHTFAVLAKSEDSAVTQVAHYLGTPNANKYANSPPLGFPMDFESIGFDDIRGPEWLTGIIVHNTIRHPYLDDGTWYEIR